MKHEFEFPLSPKYSFKISIFIDRAIVPIKRRDASSESSYIDRIDSRLENERFFLASDKRHNRAGEKQTISNRSFQ